MWVSIFYARYVLGKPKTQNGGFLGSGGGKGIFGTGMLLEGLRRVLR